MVLGLPHYATYWLDYGNRHLRVGDERHHLQTLAHLGESHYAVGECYAGLRFHGALDVAMNYDPLCAARSDATDLRNWNEVVADGRLA